MDKQAVKRPKGRKSSSESTPGRQMRSEMVYLLVNIVLLVALVIVMAAKGRQDQILPFLGLAILLVVFLVAIYVGYTYDRDPSTPGSTDWRDRKPAEYQGKYPEWHDLAVGMRDWRDTLYRVEFGFFTVCLAAFLVLQVLT